MSAIWWVHEDALNASLAPAGMPAVFVFDEAWCSTYSLKRIGFLYECLLEMEVEIRRGDTGQEIRDFAKRNAAREVRFALSPSPFIRRVAEGLRGELLVSGVAMEPFARPAAGVDLSRFSRYWRKVEKQVLDIGK
jgi:hypothetical protein